MRKRRGRNGGRIEPAADILCKHNCVQNMISHEFTANGPLRPRFFGYAQCLDIPMFLYGFAPFKLCSRQARRKQWKMGMQRKRRAWPRCAGIIVRGRSFTQGDLVFIRGLIRSHPAWGRTKLSEVVCDALGWTQPNGRAKDRACRVALARLENLGFLRLPARLIERGGQPPLTEAVSETVFLKSVVVMPKAIECRRVESNRERRLWNSLIATYHYLGLARSVGRVIRYLIFGDNQLVGAISFVDCAWSCAPRDALLSSCGYDPRTIREIVITNNRFLILPMVRIPNLASRVLDDSFVNLPPVSGHLARDDAR